MYDDETVMKVKMYWAQSIRINKENSLQPLLINSLSFHPSTCPFMHTENYPFNHHLIHPPIHLPFSISSSIHPHVDLFIHTLILYIQVFIITSSCPFIPLSISSDLCLPINIHIYLTQMYGYSTGSLTGAGHWARVHVGSVKPLLAGTLGGLLLMGEAVRRTLGAVGVHGRGLVGSWSAGCKTGMRRPKG